jgi:hypothetical protein
MGLEDFVLNTLESIGSIDFNIVSSALGIILIIFWLIIVGWVWIDVTERTSRTFTRIIYTLLVVFLNLPGLIIYLIVRPSETIEEIYWADLERRYLKFETAELGDCPKCGNQLLPGYVFCSSCGTRIKRKCPGCKVLVNKDHKYCEFCGFQLRDRARLEEKYPDVKRMEEQIAATKEYATQTVESKRTRYKRAQSFVVQLGNTIISLFNTVKGTTIRMVKGIKKSILKEEIMKKKTILKQDKSTKKKYIQKSKNKQPQQKKKKSKKKRKKK